MKIYSKKEFLKLPIGTLFSFFNEEYDCTDFCIKEESIGLEDFFYTSFLEISSFDTYENINRLDEMKEKGTSYPMNNSTRREGSFDSSSLYMVFEKQDILELIKIFNKIKN